MFDAQEPFTTVHINFETAVNTNQNLTDVKQNLLSYTPYQKYFTIEKKSLEHTIEYLKDEKQQLESAVEKTKKDLHDLKTELTETQNEVLSQTYTIKAASKPGRKEEKQTKSDTLDESNNHFATFRADSSLRSPSPSRQLIFDEDMSFQCGEDEHDHDSLEEISTTGAPSVSTRVPTSNRKRHYAKRVLWLPKKWRRMVRTHRLQSMFIKNLD